MPHEHSPDISTLSFSEIERALAEQRLPPVAKWTPANCGDSDMRIARDGTWYHQGSPIGRKAMVQLFATILRREPDGGYVLVTPVEKLDIIVEDAPFIAVELKSEGAGAARRLAFRLNTDELVIAGPQHPIRVDDCADGPHPYLRVRDGLDALLSRAVYYELANMALDEGAAPPVLWSDGACFALVAA